MIEKFSTRLNRFIKQCQARGVLGVAETEPGVAQTQGFQVYDSLKRLVRQERFEQTDYFLDREIEQSDQSKRK